MAKGKKPEDQAAYKQSALLFSKFDANRLYSALVAVFPNNQVHRVGSNKLKMRCPHPAHPDIKPSFTIDCTSGLAMCATCQYSTRNLLQVFQDGLGWAHVEGITHLRLHTEVAFATSKVEKEIEAYDLFQTALRANAWATSRHLAYCCNPPPGDPYYNATFLRSVEPALTWLFGHRHRKPEFIEKLGYGLLPQQDQLLKLCDEWLSLQAGMAAERAANEKMVGALTSTRWSADRRKQILEIIKGMYKDLDPAWTGSVTYQMGYAATVPGTMKLRRPDDEKTIITLPGTKYHDTYESGWFGLYSEHLASFGISESERKGGVTIIVVEGENDALAINECILMHGIVGLRAIASGGNANSTDSLYNAGVNVIYLIGDAKHGNGDLYVYNRLSSANRVEVNVFDRWDLFVEGMPKDPDEVILSFGWQPFYEAAVVDRAKNYLSTELWAVERAMEACEVIPETQVMQRLAAATHWGKCVKNAALQNNYVKQASQRLDLQEGNLRQQIIAESANDEESFIARIVETLKNDLTVLYKHGNTQGQAGTLTVWHKSTTLDDKGRTVNEGTPISFSVGSADAILTELSNPYGDMYTFFRDKIGFPGGSDENAEGLPHSTKILKQQRDMRDYLKIAMQQLYRGVPDLDKFLHIGQGIQKIEEAPGSGRYDWFIHNGMLPFHIWWPDPEQPIMDFKQLDAPTFGGRLHFGDKNGGHSRNQPWSVNIQTIEDLKEANTITLDEVREVIGEIEKFIVTNWRFRNQAEDARFLAWHLAALTVAPAFATRVPVAFVGLSNSGKSTAVSLFCGGQFPDMKFLEASSYQTSYTPAALQQFFERCTLLMVLEELTKDKNAGKDYAAKVQGILQVVRSAIYEGGNNQIRGTSDGVGKRTNLSTNVMLASTMKSDDEQDYNRQFEIETVRTKGLMDPHIRFLQTFSRERVARMRRVLTLGLLRWMPKLSAMHDVFYDRLNTEQPVGFPVPSRFLRCFNPLMPVMQLLGEDPWAFVQQSCLAREEQLKAERTEAIELWETITRSQGIRLGGGEGGPITQTMLLRLLAHSKSCSLINKSGCGVFYDEARKTLCIDWVAIKSPGGLLYRTQPFGNMSHRNLKMILDQLPNAIRNDDYTAEGVYDFLVHDCNVVTAASGISAVRVTALVDELRRAADDDKELESKLLEEAVKRPNNM